MLPYQEKYINNIKEIETILDERKTAASDFGTWFEEQKRLTARLDELKEENNRLLKDNLFPVLDSLFGAGPETIRELEEFSDVIMDWRTNLDCGVYVVIHDALLSLYKYRKDRDGIIKELYKLGMGLYYLRRAVEAVPGEGSRSIMFRNELVFTEAGSYMRYFDDIDNEETRGYIIRALANISLCTPDHKRKIATSKRVLDIINDEHYRELAPGLPWDVFLRRTHQQMSANRTELTDGNLSKDELAYVLDSCYEVFKPEEVSDNPSARWLWPYYEMEYNLGYVDINMTLNRMERLSGGAEYNQYDMSGLYANVQIPIYYGTLLKENPDLRKDPHRIGFYGIAVEKMFRTLFTCPGEYIDDYFYYLVDLVISSYYETEGLPLYSEVIPRILKRFSPRLYTRSRRVGAIISEIAQEILKDDPGFFDDIPFIREIGDPEKKKEAVIKFSKECGLYQDFGMVKMNIGRTMSIRDFFDNEFEIYQLHTVSGYEDLKARESTVKYADIALGHHRWYDGSGGYPQEYVRNDSPMRQMTDISAVAMELVLNYRGDLDGLMDEIIRGGGSQFSPVVTAYLGDEDLRKRIGELLVRDSEELYKEIYQELIS